MPGTGVDVSDDDAANIHPGKDGVLDAAHRFPGAESATTDRIDPATDELRDPVRRRTERRRFGVAVASTALLIPLLLVELAPGADASPDAQPTSLVAELIDDVTAVDGSNARAIGTVSGDDLAASRVFGTFSRGDELRAQAAEAAEEAERQAQAEAEAAEAAAEAEAERQRAAEERAAEERARVAELQRIEAERAAQRRAEEEAARAAQQTSGPAVGMPAGTTASQWNSLRMCESSNNYGAVNPAGPYLGAYQFLQSTWDGTARAAGRTDLVGVAPHQASPADQDSMAYALYNRSGSGPWPNCGRYLP